MQFLVSENRETGVKTYYLDGKRVSFDRYDQARDLAVRWDSHQTQITKKAVRYYACGRLN